MIEAVRNLFKMSEKGKERDLLNNAEGSIRQAICLLESHKYKNALEMVDSAERHMKEAGYDPANTDIEEVLNEVLPPLGITKTASLRKYICNEAAVSAAIGLWLADGPLVNINRWEFQLKKLEEVQFFAQKGDLDVSDYISDYIGVCNRIFRAKILCKLSKVFDDDLRKIKKTAETLGDLEVFSDVADMRDIAKKLIQKLSRHNG